MSRPEGGDGPPDPSTEPPGPPAPPGRVRPTSPGALAVGAVIGLVVGWALRPLSLRMGSAEPNVPWPAIAVIWFAGAIVAGAAYLTWRTLQKEHRRLLPHQAVNRLVLGKACALVGSVVAGGYFGYALAHLGVSDSELATTRLWRSALAGLGGLLIMVAALVLEHACRVRDDED